MPDSPTPESIKARVPSDVSRSPAAEPVLELDQVTVGAAEGYDTGLAGVALVLRPGDLCLVRLDADAYRLPLADVACGLVEPDAGNVRFRGEDWSRMGFGQANRERGRIGRVFAGLGWVANLDVDENVMLAQRHHTRRPEADLADEADRLARAFGLPGGLPRTRPAQTRRHDLARASLARAFMGAPPLLLLERPEFGVFPDAMPALIDAVQSARRGGAAVLWLTNHSDVWRNPSLSATARYAMAGAHMVEAAEG